MTSMLEKVAEAICRASPNFDELDWPAVKPIYIGVARAAIEAMREPTPKMIEAAGGENIDLTRADDPSFSPREVWADMIAAALSPNPIREEG